MEALEIHPALKGQIDPKSLTWFLYCTGCYTDKGQEELMRGIARQSNRLAWKAERSGYVYVATPAMNLHVAAPGYQFHKDFSIELCEKQIIDHSWELANTRDYEIMQSSLSHLIRSMVALGQKAAKINTKIPPVYEIGKAALIKKGYWIFSNNEYQTSIPQS